MKHHFLFLLLFIPSLLVAGDSVSVQFTKQKKLKGYRQLFYKLVLLHPKLNSPLEKELLQHYLLGSGETFLLSETDFKRLAQTVPLYLTYNVCNPLQQNQSGFCTKYVNLHNDDYFGWALGNVTLIYQTNDQAPFSLVDYYDFDKKEKRKRTVRNELSTRLFRMMAPASARSFIITYQAAVFFVKS